MPFRPTRCPNMVRSRLSFLGRALLCLAALAVAAGAVAVAGEPAFPHSKPIDAP